MDQDQQVNQGPEYFPIHLKHLQPRSITNFDLFLKDVDAYILYRGRQIVITARDLDRLIDNRVEFLYIHASDRKNYRDYLEKNLEQIIVAKNIPLERKSEVLYESAVHVVEDLFANPHSGEVFQRGKGIVQHTVQFILSGPEAFVNLLKIRAYDYYTYTHSVNVCAFLVALARAAGVTDTGTLRLLGQGGLLHDLGKSMIPAEIINKKEGLTEEEWRAIKQHPDIGMEIARENGEYHEITLSIIGQHHERLSGNGYPGGLRSDHLSQFVRMASIADVYDAITTNRSYAKMKPPAEAVRIMLGLPQEIDQEILLQFIRLIAVK